MKLITNNMREWWNGIHNRLKICRPQGIEGSSPFSRTKIKERKYEFKSGTKAKKEESRINSAR